MLWIIWIWPTISKMLTLENRGFQFLCWLSNFDISTFNISQRVTSKSLNHITVWRNSIRSFSYISWICNPVINFVLSWAKIQKRSLFWLLMIMTLSPTLSSLPVDISLHFSPVSWSFLFCSMFLSVNYTFTLHQRIKTANLWCLFCSHFDTNIVSIPWTNVKLYYASHFCVNITTRAYSRK